MTYVSTLNTIKHIVTLAPKSVPHPKRMTRQIHLARKETLRVSLSRIYDVSARHMGFPESLQGRSDFGDLDMVINTRALPEKWDAVLQDRIFGKAGFWKVPDSEVTVFMDSNGYQINVYPVTDSNEVTYLTNYLSYNGLSVLMAMLFHNHDFSYTPKGLYVKYGIDKSSEILITKDFNMALKLAGLNADRYSGGLYVETDLFNFIKESPLFDRNVFLEFEADANNAGFIESSPILKRFLADLNRRVVNETAYNPDSSNVKVLVNYFKTNYAEILSNIQKSTNNLKFGELVSKRLDKVNLAEILTLTSDRVEALINVYPSTFKNIKDFRIFVASSTQATFIASLIKLRDTMFKPEEVVEATPVVETEAPKVEALVLESSPKKKVAKTTRASAKTKKVPKVVSAIASDNSFTLAA